MRNVQFLGEAFAEVLLKYREQRGLTQRQLAEAMESARSLISFLENTKHMPSLQTFFAISEVLHVDPRELLNEVVVAMERMRSQKK